MKPDYETMSFVDAAEWRSWLETHHADTDGLWLMIYKKASGIPTVTYTEALDDALCYGWIDGLKRRYDEVSFIQKFTPRRTASLWSKRNIEHITRLSDAGLMAPAGMAEVERAKQDGRWAAAYDAASTMEVPADFLAELRKHPAAEAFYLTLNKTSLYAIAWRLQTAKTPETRERRAQKLLAMLIAGEKLH